MKSIILILGSPNDETGRLSRIAIDRIECAYSFYANGDQIKLLCTGGFGEHFNTTSQPHAQYAKEALIRKGVKEEDFLPLILSSNTYEDFEKARPVIDKELPDLLIVVTSDFHIGRARILQKEIINYPNVIFLPAKSSLSNAELEPLIEHERNAIKRLNQIK